MFGEEDPGFISSEIDETSEKYNALVDQEVKKILEVRKKNKFINKYYRNLARE